MTTSVFAQAFYTSDERDKSLDPVANRMEFCVWQVDGSTSSGCRSKSAADSYFGASGYGWAAATSESKRGTAPPNKQLPICFVCSQDGSKHYLADCSEFLQLSSLEKPRPVIAVGRCLNCDFVRNCSFRSKRQTCSCSHADAHYAVA